MLQRAEQLPRWQWLLLLFAGGSLMGWFQAPYNFWWLSFVTFPVLALGIATSKTTRASFVRGWMFAFGYFLFGLYWIANALFVDIAQFWWALPLAVAALPMGLAIFWGAAAVVTHKWGGRGFVQIVCLAGALALTELLRGHIFTGFPWLLLGYVWIDVLPVRAIAASVGTYGLTLWALLIALLPVMFFMQPTRREKLAVGVTAIVLLVCPLLNPAAPVIADNGKLSVRLVQPNIAQAMKLDPATREQIFATLLDLTQPPGSPRVVLWPETAVPYRLIERPDIRARIAASLPQGSILITGAVRRDQHGYYNSVQAMDASGQLLGDYDKAHLVPFGEYIPYRTYLPFDPIAGGVDFTAGPGPRSLRLPGLPTVGPLVCYEVIFPGQVVDSNDPPLWLLNVTNDGWYGFTHGPYQHLAITRMRAVEEGLPMVRVANTGISAVIDAYGNVTAHTQLGEACTLDAEVSLVALQTSYRALGNSPTLVMCFLLILMGQLLLLRKRHTL